MIGLRQTEIGHLADIGIDQRGDSLLADLEWNPRVDPSAQLVGWLTEDVLGHDVRTAAS